MNHSQLLARAVSLMPTAPTPLSRPGMRIRATTTHTRAARQAAAAPARAAGTPAPKLGPSGRGLRRAAPTAPASAPAGMAARATAAQLFRRQAALPHADLPQKAPLQAIARSPEQLAPAAPAVPAVNAVRNTSSIRTPARAPGSGLARSVPLRAAGLKPATRFGQSAAGGAPQRPATPANFAQQAATRPAAAPRRLGAPWRQAPAPAPAAPASSQPLPLPLPATRRRLVAAIPGNNRTDGTRNSLLPATAAATAPAAGQALALASRELGARPPIGRGLPGAASFGGLSNPTQQSRPRRAATAPLPAGNNPRPTATPAFTAAAHHSNGRQQLQQAPHALRLTSLQDELDRAHV